MSFVKIRLTKLTFKKSLPFFYVAVFNKNSGRDKCPLEIIGRYWPLTMHNRRIRINLNKERTEFWLASGAKPTSTATKILGKVLHKLFYLDANNTRVN